MSKSIKLLLCVLILGGVLCKKIFSSSDEEKLTIGILQTTSHPALDKTREGFIEELKRLSKGQVDFVVQNAEGSISQAQTIAAHFHSNKKIKAILAIATPAVQAAARIEKEKPIFIAAVSEPESLGLIYPGTNVCGTSDRIDTDAQADFILQMLPDLKRIAILYNPGESNSQAMVEKMKISHQKRGIIDQVIGVYSESEIAQAVMKASRQNEAILIPADNLLVSAMPLLAQEADKRNCPLIASDIPSVSKGAWAAQGADYRDLGIQTAQIAFETLQGQKSPESIGICDPDKRQTVLNQKLRKEAL